MRWEADRGGKSPTLRMAHWPLRKEGRGSCADVWLGPAQGGGDLTKVVASRQIPRSVPIAVGPSAHGSANLAGRIELAELYSTSYLASSEHDVDKKEMYQTNAPWSTLRRPPPS